MPPLPDAYEACTKLTEAGYTLVCITSMPNEFTEARQANFRLHNLPIEKTIAVGRDRSRSVYNPKLDALLELAPEAFVDDYAANFMEMENTSIHKALIHRNQPDSPNTNIIHLADSVHTNLSAFVDFWLSKKELQERQKLKDAMDCYAPEDDCGSGYYEDSAYGCGGY
jgi:phosphoglycolate phosphatase-like HAD superfamily hydrolase